ncbi:MAG: hypothetical protein GY719_14690 [bacterium]|nr:hypothetical protein [bacterium]
MAALIVFGIQLAVLAFPQILLTNKVESGTISLYYDEGSSDLMLALAEEVDGRLQSSGLYDRSRRDRVYYFHNQSLYEFFVRLTLLREVPQGYNLSALGNSYVSASMVRSLADTSAGEPRYGIYEGSPAHIIAHEIGHQYITDLIGRSAWKKLPFWKREGLPEYLANIGMIHLDRASSLRDRFEVLNDNAVWYRTAGPSRDGWDRVHYEAMVLVEFQLEIGGLTIEQLFADTTSKDVTMSELSAWYTADPRS